MCRSTCNGLGSNNMNPPLSTSDTADLVLANPINFPYGSLSQASDRSDFSHLIGGKFCHWGNIIFPSIISTLECISGSWMSALFDTIIGVIPVRSEKKMTGVTTWSIVTRMAHQKSWGNFAARQLECDAMGARPFSKILAFSIASLSVHRKFPRPAFAEATNFNPLPKSHFWRRLIVPLCFSPQLSDSNIVSHMAIISTLAGGVKCP